MYDEMPENDDCFADEMELGVNDWPGDDTSEFDDEPDFDDAGDEPWDGFLTDADADVLRSAGYGTDEDYGGCPDGDDYEF